MIMSFCSLCSYVLLFVAAEWWLFHCVSFSLFLHSFDQIPIKAFISAHLSLCVLNYDAMFCLFQTQVLVLINHTWNVYIYIYIMHAWMRVYNRDGPYLRDSSIGWWPRLMNWRSLVWISSPLLCGHVKKERKKE